MTEKQFRVRFRRPDGTEAYLGSSDGPVNRPQDSPALPLCDAEFAASERNRVWGHKGYRYWVEEVTQ